MHICNQRCVSSLSESAEGAKKTKKAITLAPALESSNGAHASVVAVRTDIQLVAGSSDYERCTQ
jgi:hypothetical protein